MNSCVTKTISIKLTMSTVSWLHRKPLQNVNTVMGNSFSPDVVIHAFHPFQEKALCNVNASTQFCQNKAQTCTVLWRTALILNPGCDKTSHPDKKVFYVWYSQSTSVLLVWLDLKVHEASQKRVRSYCRLCVKSTACITTAKYCYLYLLRFCHRTYNSSGATNAANQTWKWVAHLHRFLQHSSRAG